MFAFLKKLEIRIADRSTHLALLEDYDFEEVRLYKDVPVYAPADEFCREEVFAEAYAFAHGEGIFVEYKTYARDIELMAHEYQHVCQFRKHGMLFEPLYLLQSYLYGYEGNRFEVEAEAVEAIVRRKRKRKKASKKSRKAS